MEPTSLNFGGEHFKRIDRMDDDELTTVHERVRRTSLEGEVVTLAIELAIADRYPELVGQNSADLRALHEAEVQNNG